MILSLHKIPERFLFAQFRANAPPVRRICELYRNFSKLPVVLLYKIKNRLTSKDQNNIIKMKNISDVAVKF